MAHGRNRSIRVWGKSYILVIDYHSRFPEVVELRSSQSSDIIRELKRIFSRHGIPEVIMSDNRPQYASLEFIKFTREYEIRHITNSPRYPQSNEEAERMVRTVKSMLKKNEDINLGLLAYRNAPLKNGRSPVELLMGRVLRSRIPRIDSTLIRNNINISDMKNKELIYRMGQKIIYDNRHNTIEARELNYGDKVVVKDLNREEIVRHKIGDRDYQLSNNIRRNRINLNPIPEAS